MKKILAILLAVFMLLGLVACGKDKVQETKPAEEPAGDVQQEEEPADEPADEVVEEEPEEEEVEEEVVEEEVVEEEVVDEDVDADVDEEVEDEELEDEDEFVNLGYEDPKFYTYQTYMATTPSNWSPFSNETADDGDVLNMLDSGFYAFDFNEDDLSTGYVIKTEMAAELPEDLTKEYAGDENWNVPEDAEEGYVYRIKLIDYATWEDGTPINADTFVYSASQWLDPKLQNHRADMAYAGAKVFTRAKDYLYQGSKLPISLEEYAEKNGFEDIEALLAEHGEDMAQVNWANSFGEMYDAEAGAWVGEGFENTVVEAGVTINELHDLFIEKVHGDWGESEELAEQFFREETFLDFTYPEMSFDEVGIQKEDDYSILIFMDKPLVGFQFYWNMGIPLVHEELFESCKVEKEGEELITSTYGTSIDTTISYGAYRLTKFQDDKIIEFERNENWYGYHDEAHKGYYQPDRVTMTIVKEPATQLQMFLKGQLDRYGLSSDQVDDFRGSDYIYFTLSDYTGSLQMQSNKEFLEARQEPGINKTILSLKDFRKALAWSVDRADFAASTTASSSAGFGLLNSRYIADVENIIPYRDFDAAKETLLKVYGLEYGEGTDYETIDDAYAAMTGYDLDAAKELFDKAYDQAIEEGLMSEDDKIVLDWYAGEDNEAVRKTYNYMKSNWEKAVEGTKLEGKFELNLDATAGNDFGKNFRNGLSDILQAGWLGATFDPFYLISAYLDPGYRYIQAFDTGQEITIEIDGEEMTMSLDDWYDAMMGNHEEYNFGPDKADLETRVKILSFIEAAVLEDYTSTPLTYGSSAMLRSQKIEFYSEDFNELMGYGLGVKHVYFNYSDDEWDEYVKEQGGELDYK